MCDCCCSRVCRRGCVRTELAFYLPAGSVPGIVGATAPFIWLTVASGECDCPQPEYPAGKSRPRPS